MTFFVTTQQVQCSYLFHPSSPPLRPNIDSTKGCILQHTSQLHLNSRINEIDAVYIMNKKMPFWSRPISHLYIPKRHHKITTPIKSTSKGGGEDCIENQISGKSTNKGQLETLCWYFARLEKEVDKDKVSDISSLELELMLNVEGDAVEFPKQLSNKLRKPHKKGSGSEKNLPSNFPKQFTVRNHGQMPNSYGGFDLNNARVGNSDKISKRQSNNNSDRLFFGDEKFDGSLSYSSDETPGLHLISILASINIAVSLFEIASPIKNSDVGNLSLPLLYGAKVNELILVGEWWRLLTPIFLHSGFPHVALSCWALFTFGPQVCKAYGPFTFFLIYTLGGISGNLSSFFLTPEPTVGGTGPIFAIIGAWIVYQIKNREVIPKEFVIDINQKAIIATLLCLILGNFGHVDDWTHAGGTCAGIIYGFLTCPTLQVENGSPRSREEEGTAFTMQHSGACWSFAAFFLFIFILTSLFFLYEPEFTMLEGLDTLE